MSNRFAFIFIICFFSMSMAAAAINPKVMIRTELGDITLEIYVDKAPVTAENFLKYVRENRFQGAVFYRVVREDNQPHNQVKVSVIQGGLMDIIPGQSLPPIRHENTAQTGILHKDGVISMARLGPGTAASEFFICVGDQPELDFGGKRNPDGQGFAAFGRVIKGIEVVRRIQQQPAKKQYLDPKIKITQLYLIDGYAAREKGPVSGVAPEKQQQEGGVSGIVFFKTKKLQELKVFYQEKVGCQLWLDQGKCMIFKFGNMLFGFCQRDKADLDALITFFYEHQSEVDRAYKKFKEIAVSPPKQNDEYSIYHFFAHDPEGRMIEFQYFTNTIDWDFSQYR